MYQAAFGRLFLWILVDARLPLQSWFSNPGINSPFTFPLSPFPFPLSLQRFVQISKGSSPFFPLLKK